MKMAMHIDDALFERVMAATGATSKTKAIDLAFREMERRAKLVKICSEGLGMTADELKDAVDPACNLDEMRRRKTPVTYARKPRAR
jgi:Arc/MetJ family transcription regulator